MTPSAWPLALGTHALVIFGDVAIRAVAHVGRRRRPVLRRRLLRLIVKVELVLLPSVMVAPSPGRDESSIWYRIRMEEAAAALNDGGAIRRRCKRVKGQWRRGRPGKSWCKPQWRRPPLNWPWREEDVGKLCVVMPFFSVA